MAISKVIFKASANATPEVWMDATPATAGAADIMAPKTAMLADGVITTGTGSGGSVVILEKYIPETTVAAVDFQDWDEHGWGYIGDKVPEHIQIGETYRVILNNQEYMLTGHYGVEDDPLLGDDTFSDYPFAIATYDYGSYYAWGVLLFSQPNRAQSIEVHKVISGSGS